MIVREAKVIDVPLIHRLANEIWWPAYKGIISDEQITFMLGNLYSEDSLKREFDTGMKFLLAERDDKALGFAEYSITTAEEKVFRVHKLYILPSEQGRGTGKKLLEHITSLALNQGGNILELNVNRGNPALTFYKKLGFEIWQTVDIPYYHFVLNDYVMRKTI